MTKFNETVRYWHEKFGTTNKCYILNCGRDAEVRVDFIRVNEHHFYCKRCADELTTEFPNMFILAGEVK